MFPFDVAGFCKKNDEDMAALRDGRTPRFSTADTLAIWAPIALVALMIGGHLAGWW